MGLFYLFAVSSNRQRNGRRRFIWPTLISQNWGLAGLSFVELNVISFQVLICFSANPRSTMMPQHLVPGKKFKVWSMGSYNHHGMQVLLCGVPRRACGIDVDTLRVVMKGHEKFCYLPVSTSQMS